MTRVLLVLALLLSLAPSASADATDESAEKLFTRFMPPCCFTGLLKDHQSDSAEEMKEEIRSMLREGKTEEEIVGHYVSLYGERILSQPPETGFNRLAVIVPVLTVVGGTLVVGALLRRQKSRAARAAPRAPARPTLDPSIDERIEREIREET